MSPDLHFQVILQVDLRWPLTLICDLLTTWTHESSHIISINQIWFKSNFNFSNEAIFSLSYNLSSDDLWPWYMTSDHMNIWRLPYYINKPSLVPIGFQLFKWGHFHIFNQSYNLISDDLWPWYVTFNFINKWGFPCCIYDPTLVEIHQSMWKIEPNINLFSQQTTTYNSPQSDPYVSFLLRQASCNTKKKNMIRTSDLIVSLTSCNLFHQHGWVHPFQLILLITIYKTYWITLRIEEVHISHRPI